MRWPWTRRRRGRDRWRNLTQPEILPPNTEKIADMQAEAALYAALDEPTVILQSGVRVPAWLAREFDDE